MSSKTSLRIALVWAQLGLPLEALEEAANHFRLAPHRLTQVEQWGGVQFWNDSKATNFSAALGALNALDGAIYWIGGGQSKGGDIEAFAKSVSTEVETAFLYGEVAESLAASMTKAGCRVEVFSHFTDAVVAASQAALAAAPAVVLLSPGFASFDQFASYSERGESFISTVLSLKDRPVAN